MRPPSHDDFEVEHPGVGKFVYGRRTYGDRIAIRKQFLLELGCADDEGVDPDLAGMCAMIAAHRVLCVSAPPGWADWKNIDLLEEPDNESKLLGVYARLKLKEDSFRRVPAAPSTG